jgi:hypothetical protein
MNEAQFDYGKETNFYINDLSTGYRFLVRDYNTSIGNPECNLMEFRSTTAKKKIT